MISTKKHISRLAAILLSKGISDIVISPGSRNGPMIHTFAGCGLFTCYNITDERSAAYFALGLSQFRRKPVALCCTSGTAALNYAPAIAEAFYLGIPLLAITADRPRHWIDQTENQCIRQENIYRDFTKKEVTLPEGESSEELKFAGRLINECVNAAVSGKPGPVHINIPLEEPLHNLTDEELPAVKIIAVSRTEAIPAAEEAQQMAAAYNKAGKVMILAGQQPPCRELEETLASLAAKTGAVVLAEHLSNMHHPSFCTNIDMMFDALNSSKKLRQTLPTGDDAEAFRPDLLITFGGHIVSKSLKQFLRANKPSQHWHLDDEEGHADTYLSLTTVTRQSPLTFFRQLDTNTAAKDTSWTAQWKQIERHVNGHRDAICGNAVFSDLKVFEMLRKAIPHNSVIHIGNSSPVRYALLGDDVPGALYLGNRGVSGIDGILSTAVGYAYNSDSNAINTVILGDLSFFYDSNALWNNYISTNLRIVVINNGGGNIFGMLEGPDRSPVFREHFFATNNFSAAGIAATYGLDYLKAHDENGLQQALTALYDTERRRATLLEVFTDATTNSMIFKKLTDRSIFLAKPEERAKE